MLNQANYDLINKHMIAPLCVLFNKKLNDEIIDGFVEELQGFDEQTLKTSFKALRRECKYFPSLAQVIEVCKENIPVLTTSTQKAESKSVGFLEITNPSLAEKILSSEIGQKALNFGIARELMCACAETNKQEFSEVDLEKYRADMRNAASAAAGLRSDDPLHKSLLGLFNAMMDREQRLYKKYYKQPVGVAA